MNFPLFAGLCWKGMIHDTLVLPVPSSHFMQGPMPRSGGMGAFTCSDCGRAYQQYASLWRHRNYECGKLPQFRCPYCSHRSKRKSNLNKHIKIIHNVDMGHVEPGQTDPLLKFDEAP